jgi:zinc transport system substrate-binding protein
MAGRLASLVVALALVASAVACGSDDAGGADAGGRLTVVAAFYPLAWMAEEVGGQHVAVRSLTGSGQEPHDLEVAPREVAAVIDADAVVYLRGFQAAVDDAVDQASSGHVFDAAGSANLDRVTDGATDPHFWLDPARFTAVIKSFTRFLVARDAAHASDYLDGRDRLISKLRELDDEMRVGLASCEQRALVTSHEAFGYLAERFGFTQVGISGLTPEAEPSPAKLAEVARFVEDHDVTTIYFETLVSPDVARSVASETGARTAVLDPIESISSDSPGRDYLSVMRADLASLRAGQSCS